MVGPILHGSDTAAARSLASGLNALRARPGLARGRHDERAVEPDEEELDMSDPRSVIERWLDAIEARDAERIMAMMTDDVSVETEALDQPITGRQAATRWASSSSLDLRPNASRPWPGSSKSG
jgi:hypothetical protein